MKHLIQGSFSLLLIVGTTTNVVQAQVSPGNPATVNSVPSYQISPVDLAEQAYRGYLKPQGIPSYDELISAYQDEKISPKDIVESAIKAGMLQPQVRNNKDYLNALDDALESLAVEFRGG